MLGVDAKYVDELLGTTRQRKLTPQEKSRERYHHGADKLERYSIEKEVERRLGAAGDRSE